MAYGGQSGPLATLLSGGAIGSALTSALGGLTPGNSNRGKFLTTVFSAVYSTSLVTIVTPDGSYNNFNLTSFDFRRTAQNGTTMLTVNLIFEQVLLAPPPAFTNTSQPSSIATTDLGTMQTQTVSVPDRVHQHAGIAMQSIPLSPIPNQTFGVLLDQQNCQINLYTRLTAPGHTALFLDLSVNNALVIGGVLCLNRVLIVRQTYLGFAGDLAFLDTITNSTNPVYTGLGTAVRPLLLRAGRSSHDRCGADVSGSITQRQITIAITLGTGTFGKAGGNTVTLSGLRCAVTVERTGLPGFGTATARIYGMQDFLMRQLSSLGVPNYLVRNNTITISAGDAVAGVSAVYKGTITDAWADYSGAPDVAFNVNSFTPVC
nr:hypothetical protein [uncultured Lichenicoccus sp.]